MRSAQRMMSVSPWTRIGTSPFTDRPAPFTSASVWNVATIGSDSSCFSRWATWPDSQ